MKILVLLLLVFLVAGAVYALNDSKKRPASGATHTLSDSDKATLLTAAQQAYQQQDYATALEKWLTLAEAGDTEAQFDLGTAYSEGKAMPRNDAKAREWLEKSAAQNNAAAQFNLGVHYSKGEGVPQDFSKARAWFEKAAAQKNDEEVRQAAQHALQILDQVTGKKP